MAAQPAAPAHYCPACRTTTPAPEATAEALVQAGADHRAECTGQADLRQRIAAAIWERRNPGHDWAEALYPWKADDEADADAVLAVVQPELDQLRAELDRTRAELADARYAWRRLKTGLIANANLLDVPFTNAPTQSPWKRLKPYMQGLDNALKHAATVSAPTTT